jgi:hypothetical protein
MGEHPEDRDSEAFTEHAGAARLRDHLARLRWVTRICFAVAVYAVCWITAYVVVNDDLDTHLLVQYFVLAWTGQGLERPFFTWIVSCLFFVMFLIGWWIRHRRVRTAAARRNRQVDSWVRRID